MCIHLCYHHPGQGLEHFQCWEVSLHLPTVLTPSHSESCFKITSVYPAPTSCPVGTSCQELVQESPPHTMISNKKEVASIGRIKAKMLWCKKSKISPQITPKWRTFPGRCSWEASGSCHQVFHCEFAELNETITFLRRKTIMQKKQFRKGRLNGSRWRNVSCQNLRGIVEKKHKVCLKNEGKGGRISRENRHWKIQCGAETVKIAGGVEGGHADGRHQRCLEWLGD